MVIEQTKQTLSEKMADLILELLDQCQSKQEKISKNMNLMLAEWKALRYFKKDKILSVGELAKRMGLTSSRLTRIIDGLVEKDIVRRDLSKHDRRVMEVIITIEGEKVIKQVREHCISIHQGFLDLIPEEERQNVVNSLEKIQDAMKMYEKI
jgi:DNA-binding MarR family transcriptional regulator